MNHEPEILVRHEHHVTIVTLRQPPHNFLNVALVKKLADTMDALDCDPNCRVVVLAAEGKSFCAGANFNSPDDGSGSLSNDPTLFYAQAMRLFKTRKPVVAAVHGAAIGAGLGLAVAADFRVTCAEARFSANFSRLGFHPGFGLSLTLPRLIGEQKAALLLYTGRRITGSEAVAIGLADELVAQPDVLDRAMVLAREIAESAPMAVQSTRETLRGDLAARAVLANKRELALQQVQFLSGDFREGVQAMTERRQPLFTGT